MAKFKNKNGEIVLTRNMYETKILRSNLNYTEIDDNKPIKEKKSLKKVEQAQEIEEIVLKEEVAEVEPLQ